MKREHHSPTKRNTFMNSEKYVGLDVHQATISVAVTSRTSLPTAGHHETVAAASTAGTVGRESQVSDQHAAVSDSLHRADPIGPAGSADSDSPSFSHQAAVVGLQRTGPGDPNQRGILLCRRPAAALEETTVDPRSE